MMQHGRRMALPLLSTTGIIFLAIFFQFLPPGEAGAFFVTMRIMLHGIHRETRSLLMITMDTLEQGIFIQELKPLLPITATGLHGPPTDNTLLLMGGRGLVAEFGSLK